MINANFCQTLNKVVFTKHYHLANGGQATVIGDARP
jgi:hypothetical protein